MGLAGPLAEIGLEFDEVPGGDVTASGKMTGASRTASRWFITSAVTSLVSRQIA